MLPLTTYSRAERVMLVALASIGFLVVNGAFLYGALFQNGTLGDAIRNPVAAAFIVEALLLVWVFAYLLRKWGVSQLHPLWFVILSLIGSIAFALPVALLWREKSDGHSSG